MKRLFVAIDLPEAIKAQIKPLCADLSGVKWVSNAQMHLTLRFIGDADDDQQKAIQTGLAAIHAAPFSMSLKGVGQFPSKGKPRVIWVGLQAEDELNSLQKQVETIISESGFGPSDHAFSPHITLARIKIPPPQTDVQRYFERHQHFKTDAFQVEQFILFSSQLTSSNPIYRRESTFQLT